MELAENNILQKNTEEFTKNLNMILSQVVVDKDIAEKILLKNENNVINSMIEILDYKPPNQNLDNEEDIHKTKIKELRQIMKDKDKLFNEISKNKDTKNI